MKHYIALFRGINVGGNNILSMKELTHIMTSMGYENIRTYIQSGNVVFQSQLTEPSMVSQQLSRGILDHQGFQPKY